jgi:hypothetical protein
MRKSLLSLLVVATVIATILVAGCTSSTSPTPSPQVVSTSNSSTTATTSSSSEASSVSPSPSASASPTPTATPTATPTPTASPTSTPQSVATSIRGDPTFLVNPTITRNSPVSWLFAVGPTGSAPPTLPASTVTAKINNNIIGQVTTFSGGTDNVAVSFTSAQTNSLTAGHPYTLTLSFAGYGKYEPSTQPFPITVQ